jgi:hypothetical protein
VGAKRNKTLAPDECAQLGELGIPSMAVARYNSLNEIREMSRQREWKFLTTFSEYYGKLGSNGSREDDLTMLFSVPSQTIRLGLCSFAVEGCGFASGWLLEYLLGSL